MISFLCPLFYLFYFIILNKYFFQSLELNSLLFVI